MNALFGLLQRNRHSNNNNNSNNENGNANNNNINNNSNPADNQNDNNPQNENIELEDMNHINADNRHPADDRIGDHEVPAKRKTLKKKPDDLIIRTENYIVVTSKTKRLFEKNCCLKCCGCCIYFCILFIALFIILSLFGSFPIINPWVFIFF